MSCENCVLKEPFETLKDKVDKISDDLGVVKIENAETRVYVKQIFEKLDDLKSLPADLLLLKTMLIAYKEQDNYNAKHRSNVEKIEAQSLSSYKKELEFKPIIFELLKLLGTVITILASLAGYNMIIGGR